MAKKAVIFLKNKLVSLVKKRSFYIALVVIFSILLLADTGIGLLAPAQMQMADHMGDRMGMDREDFGEAGKSGQMPGMSGEIQSGGMLAARFLYAVKSHWLILFAILALLDIACIVMLVYLTKKKKARYLLELKEKMEADGELHLIRKPEKKSRHAYVAWIVPVAGLLLVVVVVKILTAQSTQKISRTEASIYSAEAEKGSICTVLPGTGTLAEEEAETLDLPEEVEISEWYVSDGDIVEAGDKLAKVDKTSVMTAIAGVQETLDLLDEEMAEHEEDEVSETVQITAGGRVKAVYAQEDVDVVNTMYEYGALMLISLDGTMAVSIETEENLSAGDPVVVTLSDGTEESGKVESSANGTAVITLTDDGPEYGDAVSVSTDEGTALGSGELYIHSELKVTGFIGTVTDVAVSVEDEVDAGDELLTLENTGYSGEYELLAAKRAELEEEMQTLFQLYEEEYVYAQCAGKISGFDGTVTATGTDESSAENTESSEATASSAESTGSSADAAAAVQPLKYVSAAARSSSGVGKCASINACTVTTLSAASDPEDPEPGESEGNEGNEEPEGETEDTESSSVNTDEISYVAVVSSVSYQEIRILLYPAAYDAGGSIDPDAIMALEDQMTVEAALDLSSITDSLYLYRDGERTEGTVKDIQAGCFLVLSFESDPLLDENDPVVKPVSVIYMEPKEEEAEGEDNRQEESGGNSETPSGSENGKNSDDGENSGNGKDGENSSVGGNQESGSGSQGTVSGMVGNTGSDSGMIASTVSGGTDEELKAAAEEIEEQYSVGEVTWLSITPQDSMEITISVDEMDILALEEGQEAAVTLDAFPGQSFEGVVTSIDKNGANSGGSSKYTAIITIDRSEDMLVGMNASVKITLETAEDILTIPVAALVEDETGVYVYTEYDEDDETLGGLTEVATGVSDGESVEILSGLNEGSEYWYSCLDVVNYSSSYVSSQNSGGFSLDSLFGGGGRH